MTTKSNTARRAEVAPTLRERADRLRDAAGRFVRRKPPEAAPVASEGSAAVPDPILAAIAETERLTVVRNAAADLPMPEGRLDPLPEQDAAQDAFWAHVDDVLLKTVPATAAGCAALARYAIDFLKRNSFVLDEHEGNEHVRILDLIARSPLLSGSSARPDDPFEGTTCPPGFVPYPFDNPTSYSSIQGVVIPAEAQRLLDLALGEYGRCCGSFADYVSEERREEIRQAKRAALHIEALTALVQTTSARGTVQRQPDAAQVRGHTDRPDLSQTGLRELAAIHDAARLVAGVADAIGCQPRCYTSENGSWNAVGLFADAISETCGAVLTDVVREAMKRTPKDGWESGLRLKVLAEHVIENDDKAALSVFVSDLHAMG